MEESKRSAQNVQVVVRCRPVSQHEIDTKQATVCKTDEASRTVEVKTPQTAEKKNIPNRTYTFDAVYGPSSSQRDIYIGTVAPILEEVLEGYNCTIFCYGQTGTGKTYTMEGPSIKKEEAMTNENKWKANHQAGIITRSVTDIFSRLNKAKSEYSVKVSHLELYNEELIDLLNLENKSLKLFEDPNSTSSDSVTVHGLTEVSVYTPQEIFDIVAKSSLVRRTAETKMNRSSSRSHCIFAVTIYIKELINGEEVLKMGKLNLVDLAGSENVSRSGVRSTNNTGKSESGMINKSLLTLGRVITALVDHSPHIPYRDSKLTRLLQDSLGGRTKTCIIATISPSSPCLDETINTLEYAHRAKNICNQPQLNKTQSKQEILSEYAVEIEDLRAQLVAMRQKSGIYIPADEFDKMQAENDATADKTSALEEYIIFKEKELEEIKELLDRHASSLLVIQGDLADAKMDLDETNNELEATKQTLYDTETQLTERKIILHDHIKAEAEFQKAAEQVTATLAASLKDIKGLHQRIDRASNLQEMNNSTFVEVKSIILEEIADVEENVQEFVANQDKHIDSLITNVDLFLHKREEDIRAVAETVKRLERILASKYAQLQSAGSEGLAQNQEIQGRLEKKHRSFQTEIQNRAQPIATLNQNYMESCNEALRARTEKKNEWCEERRNEIDLVAQATAENSKTNQSIIEKTTALVEEKMDVSDLSNSQHSTIAEFKLTQKQEMEAFKKALLSQLEKSIDSFITQQTERVQEETNTHLSNFDTKMKDITNIKSNLVSSFGESVRRQSAFELNLSVGHESIASHINQNQETSSSFYQDFAQKLSLHVQTDAQEVNALVQKNHENSNVALDDIAEFKENLNHVQKQFSDFVNEANTSTSQTTQQMTQHLDNFTNGLVNATSQWSSEFQSVREEMLNCSKLSSDNANSFLEQLRSLNLIEYEKTGETPVKKTVSYLPKIDHTRADVQIVAQHLNGGQPLPSFIGIPS